jgi:hypothetical protein
MNSRSVAESFNRVLPGFRLRNTRDPGGSVPQPKYENYLEAKAHSRARSKAKSSMSRSSEFELQIEIHF